LHQGLHVGVEVVWVCSQMMTACLTSASSANRLPARLVLGSPKRWNWAPHRQTGWEVINSPPYSPDLVPSDVNPIAPLEMCMAGKRLIADADVKQAVTLRLQTHNDFFFCAGIQALVPRWGSRLMSTVTPCAHVPCIHWSHREVLDIRVFITLFFKLLCICCWSVYFYLDGMYTVLLFNWLCYQNTNNLQWHASAHTRASHWQENFVLCTLTRLDNLWAVQCLDCTCHSLLHRTRHVSRRLVYRQGFEGFCWGYFTPRLRRATVED